MAEVDTQHMTREERAQHQTLLAARRHADTGPAAHWHPVYMPGYIVTVLTLIAAFDVAVSSGISPSDPMFLVPSFAVIAVGGVIAIVLTLVQRRRWRTEERVRTDAAIAAYLSEIGYEERASARGRSHDGPRSLREMQHQWYGGHSELDWRDRERAEMFGMDVETYISNVKEAD